MKHFNESFSTIYTFVRAGNKRNKDGVRETISVAPRAEADFTVDDLDESSHGQYYGALAFGDLRSTVKAAEKAAAALASEPEGSSSRRPKPPQVI
jgi:hypothetical protein